MNSQVEHVSSAADLWSNFVQYRVAQFQRTLYRGRPDNLLQACQTIDEELAAMRLAMSSLLAHRNTLTPISILPPEILTRIFQFHAADQPPLRHVDQVSELGWIRVTHVCRLWRGLVLDNPAMWSDLTTNLGLRWLELMVERANSMPLSYSQINRDQDSVRFLTQVIPDLLFRIHSFSVSDTPDAFAGLATSLRTPAPMLQTLELTVMAVGNYSRRVILPNWAFRGDSPMLRRLHLDKVCVLWTAPFLHGLTYLHIEQDKCHATPQTVREDDFFRALEAMPALETLYLASVLPTNISEASIGDRTIRLPCLWTLTLIDEGPRCLHVFKQLHIPPSCRVHLECVDHNNPSLEAALPFLCRQIPARADSFQTLSVVYTDEHTVGLKLWRASSVSAAEVFHSAQDPDLFMSVFTCWSEEGDDEDYIPAEPMEIMCDALPLDDIRVVRVATRECDRLVSDCIGWQRLARNCREISTIILDRGSDVRDLCEAMLEDESAQKRGQHTDAAQNVAFLPNFKVLELDAMDLRPLKTRKGTKIETGKALADALAVRRARGRAVSTVRLGKGCIIDATRLKALRDVVHVEYGPISVQQIPKAPVGKAEGFVYADREMRDPSSSRWL